MFSHEQFDFPPTGHPADAHLDALDPFHDALFDSYIDSSCVDQSFCSDFACCGQKLPDLHRLLEHFEDEHVLPLTAGADARSPFSSPTPTPSPVYAQPRPAALAPYAAYILSYPQPDPPLQHPHRALSPSPTASGATSAQSSPGPAEPICLPPSLLSVKPSPSAASRRDRRRARDASDTDIDIDVDTDETDETDEEDAPPARPAPVPKSSSLGGVGPHRRAKKKKSCSAARMDPVSARRTESARLAAALPPAPKRRDGREKAFKCPHTGCTKSYLNPNGLKYHLEKGTCTNADVRGRESLPAPTPAPAPAVHPTATTETAAEASLDSGLPPAQAVAVMAEEGGPARLEVAEGRA